MATPLINARCTLMETYMEQKMGNELETGNIYIYISSPPSQELPFGLKTA